MGHMVWRSVWPWSLDSAAVKYRPALLAPGWVTTQVFSDEAMAHIHAKVLQSYRGSLPFHRNRQNPPPNGQCSRSLKKKYNNIDTIQCYIHLVEYVIYVDFVATIEHAAAMMSIPLLARIGSV